MVLGTEEIDSFLHQGYVVLRSGVPEDTVSAVTEAIWRRIGFGPADKAEWPTQMVHIWEAYASPPFSEAWTDRVIGAIDDLVGENRYDPPRWLGYWPILFPEPDGYRQAPAQSFHIDGQHFRRHLDSPERALIALFVFTDAGPDSGGTEVRPGSHVDVARAIAASEPAGMTSLDAVAAALESERPTAQLTTRAGDVVLMHPFLLHRSGKHHGATPRVACNAHVTLKEPLRIGGEADRQTPVERAISLATSAREVCT